MLPHLFLSGPLGCFKMSPFKLWVSCRAQPIYEKMQITIKSDELGFLQMFSQREDLWGHLILRHTQFSMRSHILLYVARFHAASSIWAFPVQFFNSGEAADVEKAVACKVGERAWSSEMMRTQITLKVKTLSAEVFKFEAATTKIREVLINGGYNPYKWYHKWVSWGHFTLLIRVITVRMPGFGGLDRPQAPGTWEGTGGDSLRRIWIWEAGLKPTRYKKNGTKYIGCCCCQIKNEVFFLVVLVYIWRQSPRKWFPSSLLGKLRPRRH